jgi:hypothetical protein
MPFATHDPLHSMLPISSLVLSIPYVELSIQPSSSSAPYFMWLTPTFLYSLSLPF